MGSSRTAKANAAKNAKRQEKIDRIELVPCEPFRERFAVMAARGEINLTQVAHHMHFKRRRSSTDPTVSARTRPERASCWRRPI